MAEPNYSIFEFCDLLEFISISSSALRYTTYSPGEVFTQVEMHTIGYLAQHPGVTVTDMAMSWCRTKGSISQMIKKLEAQELIYREKEKENSKSAKLFLTEKGIDLQKRHVAYDNEQFGRFLTHLGEIYSQEELNATFSVLQSYLEEHRKLFKNRLEEDLKTF